MVGMVAATLGRQHGSYGRMLLRRAANFVSVLASAAVCQALVDLLVAVGHTTEG